MSRLYLTAEGEYALLDFFEVYETSSLKEIEQCNNLPKNTTNKVFEQELSSTTKSSASAQNVAFVSHSKSSTNKVKSGHTGAYSTYTPSTSSNNILEREVPAGFADEVIYSLFAKQSRRIWTCFMEDFRTDDDYGIEEMAHKLECPSKGTNDGKKRDSFYQDQGARKKEQNQNCLLTMDDGVVNWGEHTEEEVETNHALMAISSNNEGPQKHKASVLDEKSNEHSTCQSNDSEGSFGNPSEHSSESESKSISNKLKNQETPKVNRKNWNEMMERELGEGYSFIKKKCFVCGSLSHLIRDCNFYENKMARETEIKKQRVFNTGNGVAKPVWNNANRVNHANHFVHRPVQLNALRPNSNSVRPNVNTGRANVNSAHMQDHPLKNMEDHPLKNMEDRGIFDSGCSAHMLDYGFNFMNTKIHIDNESTICIVKNPVYHSKTKHIEIRHHFIRDSYEKKLIRVEKIHTDFNVADLLTKAFDGPRFNFLVVNIGYTWIARRIGAWIKVELKLCKS
ncbi:putative ribonuclease H-like domain-containing protein [Tanacetum coccineum]|uniref:Ribonuclease H-like domain-containing protein n=1 Tax=Tanacetum coccineum TaxID=301880 RepID=A0ABQ5D9L0_9ASTR